MAISTCAIPVTFASVEIDPETITYEKSFGISLDSVDHWQYVGTVKSRVKEFVKNTTHTETETVRWEKKIHAETSAELNAKIAAEINAVGYKASAEVGGVTSNSSGYSVTIEFTSTETKEVEYAVYQDYMYKYKKYKNGSAIKHVYYGKYKVGKRYEEKL